MTYNIFYSWQSDIHPEINRYFIEKALNKAILNLSEDFELDEAIRQELALDQDTRGVPGTPPVTDTIFSKIQNSAIYVADLTFVGKSNKGRFLANPNVLIEYGYAVNSIGYKRIIPIINTAFGEPISNKISNMPFDMRHLRNPITYSLKENASNEKQLRTENKLIENLTEAIRTIIDSGMLNELKRSKEALTCDHCGHKVEFGHTVCLGCRADVVYGATDKEAQEAVLAGFLAGSLLCIYLLSELPKWLASHFGWPLVSGWGLGMNVFWPGAVLMSLTIFISVRISDSFHRKGKPRFLRQKNV
jgi:hypothetical protein